MFLWCVYTDSLNETDIDESASDFSVESQLKPSNLGDVNSITPPLSTNDHVRTSPLELSVCNTSNQMSLLSFFETSSSSRVSTIDLPKMTPSRAHPPESLPATQSVGCDENGFTLVTWRKRRRISPRWKLGQLLIVWHHLFYLPVEWWSYMSFYYFYINRLNGLCCFVCFLSMYIFVSFLLTFQVLCNTWGISLVSCTFLVLYNLTFIQKIKKN